MADAPLFLLMTATAEGGETAKLYSSLVINSDGSNSDIYVVRFFNSKGVHMDASDEVFPADGLGYAEALETLIPYDMPVTVFRNF
jgi:hypothetical protein